MKNEQLITMRKSEFKRKIMPVYADDLQEAAEECSQSVIAGTLKLSSQTHNQTEIL